MLPLVQTHPRVVPVPVGFESFGTPAARPEADRRAIASPYHLSASHLYGGPVPSAAAGQCSRDHDHHLRRKTPRGTIDAGYDGSPTQLSPGPPPLKQLILPTPSGIYPYVPPNNLPFNAKSRLPNADAISLGQAPAVSPWSLSYGGHNFVLSSGSSMLPPPGPSWQPYGYPMFSQVPGMYQPLMRAAEYNVRAFCPPPASAPDAAAFNQFGWQLGASQQTLGYFDPSQYPEPRPMLLPGSIPHHTSDVQLPYRPVPDFKAGHPAVPFPSQPLVQGGYLSQSTLVEDAPAGEQYAVQASFTEKVYSKAQAHYVELLAYLQTARRLDQMSNGGTSSSRFKVLVFPRPPKSRKEHFDTFRSVNHGVERPIPSTIMPTGHPGALTSNIEDTLSNSAMPPSGQDVHVEAHRRRMSATHFRTPSNVYSPSSSFAAVGPAAMTKALPILNAKASFDMLKNICEQSNWKWIDGILLGGCLLYGLSRFEDAVDWFSRVLALDSRFDLFQMNYQVVVLYLTQIIAMLRLLRT